MLRIAAVIFTAALLAAAPVRAGEVAVGQPAPAFALPDQDGEMHTLEDYRDQWVVLYFYPKDDTPGCTTEACEFRDDIFKFRRMGSQVIGVSLDDQASHAAFAEKHGLPFPLLADTEGKAADAYGVKGSFAGMTIAKRQTFLIDPDGLVAKHYEKVDPETHSKQVLADLEALQSD